MKTQRLPFNVSILDMSKVPLKAMTPVSVLDIFENAGSTNFHGNGLFSTEIFGRVGDDARDSTFSYIPLKTKILHPFIFSRLERLKRLYIGILSGKEFAIWDDNTKEFTPADEIAGKTGYQFFMSHWDELVIAGGESPVRRQRAELINKYRKESITTDVLVLPAGLRDAEVDNGRIIEDDINAMYRRLIGISNTIGRVSNTDIDLLDTTRYSQQLIFNEIYAYIENILTGKRGMLQNRFGSRRIMDGTRNVITAMDMSTSNIDSNTTAGPNDTIVGLWQLSRGALPISINALRTGILSQVFGSAEGNVRLIDTKTLKSELVRISPQTFDRWSTVEGLEKVINLQKMVGVRSKPVMVEGRYLALVYKPKNLNVFKIFTDIDTVPENIDKNDIYPITLEELIYLSNYRNWNKLKIVVTRYPITGEGSTYVSNVFARTTVNSEARVELDDNWIIMDPEENTAVVYPVFDVDEYVDSMSVHPFKLAGLGGDFDGDMTSGNVLYTTESIGAIDSYLRKREAHINPVGGLRASAAIDTINYVMYSLTG